MDDREVNRLLTLAANSPGGVWPPNALVKEGRKDRGMTPECFQVMADEIEQLRTALTRSMVAIDDWLHQYAGELCDEKRVAESWARINKHGTIGYICEVQEQNRHALGQLTGDVK
jgi:hypothetical protein